MAIRSILKKLKTEIDSKFPKNKARDEEYYKLFEDSLSDASKQAAFKKYERKHCIKLQPFTIPVGTRLVQKTSGSSCWYGTIVIPCKAIGLLNNFGYELLLDRPACMSDFCKKHQIPLEQDDDKVLLSKLPTEILEKIDNAIIR